MGRALSVVAKIKPGMGAELEKVLVDMGFSVKARTADFERFQDVKTLHFCRFVLMPQERRTDAPWAFIHFESNYDGDLDTHLNQWAEHVGGRMADVWSKCEGFDHTDPVADPERFKRDLRRFIKKNSYYTPTFYQGYPRDTSVQVRSYLAVGSMIREFFCQADAARYSWEGRFRRFVDLLPLRPRSPLAFLQPIVNNLSIIAALLIALLDAIVQGFNLLVIQPLQALLLRRAPALNLNYAPQELPNVHEFEDVVSQNALTVVSQIAPGWRNMARLRFFLWFINIVARNFENKGSLGGISTIHFARWFIIDKGRYLLFNSNYDGSWENYIGDFVDLNAMGMDWVWQCTPDYPYAVKDMEGFKRIIREYQLKVQCFYSAYPDSTVFNIINDRALTQPLDQENASAWLRRV